MPPLTLGLGFARGPVTAPSLILDSLSAGAAYSTRKLRTAYAGSAIRVRRSSDNTEQDIGFSGNALDTTALTSFVGANSGFVVTWYDQSGNARHVTQAAQADQPRIVNAGTIEVRNSVPSLVFDGTNDILFNSSPFMYSAGTSTLFAVVSWNTKNDVAVMAEDNSTLNNPIYRPLNGLSTEPDTFSSIRNDEGSFFVSQFGGLGPSNAFETTLTALFARDTGATLLRSVNGTTASQNYTRSGTLTLDRFNIGGTRTGSLYQGTISEVICFSSALSNTDVNTVALNQGAAYGITVNPI